jgi:hypothetical protein
MIEANELRRNNLFRWDDESQNIVTCTGFNLDPGSGDWFMHYEEVISKESSAAALVEFAPIPITLDILVRVEFVNGLDIDDNEVMRFGEFELSYYNLSGNLSGYYYVNGMSNETPVKYVHELQNLFFALTGVELVVGVG